MGRDESILNGVERIVGIAEAGDRNAVESVAMAADDFGESPVLAGEAECHEFIVGGLPGVTAHGDLR